MSVRFYFLIAKGFGEVVARRKCMLGFMIAFPVASLTVGRVAIMILFAVGVAKFGF